MMKKIPWLPGLTLIALVLPALFFSSCQDEFATVQDSVAVNLVFGADPHINYTSTLDFSANSEIRKHNSIVRVSYQLDHVSDNASGSTFSGLIGFSSTAESAPTVVLSITLLDLHDTAPHEFLIAPEQSGKISNTLKHDGSTKLYLIGDIKNPPVNCSMIVSVEVAYPSRTAIL